MKTIEIIKEMYVYNPATDDGEWLILFKYRNKYFIDNKDYMIHRKVLDKDVIITIRKGFTFVKGEEDEISYFDIPLNHVITYKKDDIVSKINTVCIGDELAVMEFLSKLEEVA